MLAALLLLSGAGGALWWVLRPGTPRRPPPIPIQLAREATILAHTPAALAVFRFADNPKVLVLDFPDLHQQGAMLNRVAALIEKAGAPRDRVLNDAELAATIGKSGDTPDTYYYGHDYGAASLARFFELADRDHIALDKEEEWLRRLARQEGWLAPSAVGGLISLPRTGSASDIDARARQVILHHELSHGEYFTSPAYADWVHRFWREGLTDRDRAAFRRFLGGQGYDIGEEDVMINEMQAYLMETRDPRYFSAEALGLPQARVEQLQAAFLIGMPVGWLRDATLPPGAVLPATAPRRRYFSRVSRTRAVPAARAPRLRASSIAA
jgi:hypothetical protein